MSRRPITRHDVLEAFAHFDIPFAVDRGIRIGGGPEGTFDPSPTQPLHSRLRTAFLILLRALLVIALVCAVVWLIANWAGLDLLDDAEPSETAETTNAGTQPAVTAVGGSSTASPVSQSRSWTTHADTLLDQALQRKDGGLDNEACQWFGAAWQALPAADRARLDTAEIANAERECRRHEHAAGAMRYERALRSVTPSP